MELEESVASIIYIFLFAAFLTICVSQSDWLKTSIIGLDTLSEFQTDLVNDFIYSPCFVAKNNQGNNLHGVFDADLLDDHTEKKLISEIITMPPKFTDYTINYAPTISTCVNTKDNYYFYEIHEKEGPKRQWIFGNSSKLSYWFDKTWTIGKKPISIKRGDTISSGMIYYGFSKNPAKLGNPFIIQQTTTDTCKAISGTQCSAGDKCIGGESFNMFTTPTAAIPIPTPPVNTPTAPTTTNEIILLCCYDGGVCEP